MPTVTALEVQKRNKNRVNVYLDGEFYCGMEALSAVKFGLKTGVEVDTDKLQRSVADSETFSAFNKAVDYLSRAPKTEKQITDYLVRKGYDEQIIDNVRDKLRYYKYIDDERYAEMYVEQNSKTKGARRLKQELLAKGISQDKAEQHSTDYASDNYDNACRLAQKYMRNKTNDLPTLAKLSRYLLSRGYNYDTVNSVVAIYKGEQQ